MLRNVICIKWGTKFNAGYVNHLYHMVEKHLSLPHRFVCFTDDGKGVEKGVEIFPLPPLDDTKVIDRGWKKLGLFADTLADLQGEALFLDLDVIILDSLDDFFKVPGKFLIIKDWLFSRRSIIGNSSVFRFSVGQYPEVIEKFYREGRNICDYYRNEQAFLSHEMAKKGILQYWEANWCISFKRGCLAPWPLCYLCVPKEPKKAKILVFHGHPTPIEAYYGYSGKYGYRYVKPTRWLGKYCPELGLEG